MRPQEAFIKELSKGIVASNSREKASLLESLDQRRQKGRMAFSNLELARQRAAYIKWKVNENLDKYLVDFEASVIRKGGKVIWAYDAANALTEIDAIIARTGATRIVKSKSSLSREIGLTDHLRKKGINTCETDVGDYLADLMNLDPFHPILPAVHQQRDEVTKTLNLKIKSSLEADNQELVSDIRAEVRGKFFDADLGISGANFLIADSGLVAISENEGNARLSFAFAKTHVVLASIDKILPTIGDLELFFSLLSTHSTGQQLATYNTITGPVLREEIDGPSEFIVILIDNGRSSVLGALDQRSSLSCIKCGACSNVCPVFKVSGGESSYQSFRGGPIGEVVAPLQQGFEDYRYLSEASTLCGKCTDVCPVKIDLHNHLLRNRHETVTRNLESTGEKLAWYTWKKLMLSRKNMNRQTSIRNFTLRQFYKTDWGESREFPKLAEKSFNQLWREKHQIN